MTDDYLRYGDLLVLRSQEYGGSLTSFGFLESGCYLQGTPAQDLRSVPNNRSMIFRILPKLSYDACEDFQRALKRPAGGGLSLERLSSLRLKCSLEDDLNERTVEQVSGSVVFYGHEIQLQHLSSGMLLTGQHEAAEFDRACYRILLSDSGSEGAHFQVQPQLHLRRVGDPVVYQDLAVLLCVPLQMHLHVSGKALAASPLPASANRALSADMASTAVDYAARYEVNVSLELSPFKLEPFSSGSESQHLRGGTVIRVQHTELSALLCSEGIDYTRDGLADVFLRKAKSDHPYEDVSAHTLFILEQSEAERFGKTCVWREGEQRPQYRLRHLTTRRLIGVAEDNGAFILSLDKHPYELQSDQQELEHDFVFLPTAIEETNSVRNASIVHIQTANSKQFWSIPGQQWMLAPQLEPESRGEDLDYFSPFEIDELAVTHTKVVMQEACDRKDAYILSRVSDDEVREIEFVMSSLSTLRRCSVSFERQLSVSRSLLLGLEATLGRLILFCVQSASRDPYSCEGEALPRRQKFLRELGVIDLACSVLRHPFVSGACRLEDLEGPDLMAKVCMLSYRLVRLAAKDNRANELYCAQWMGLFLYHAEHTWQNDCLHPEETLTEILSDNRRLLEQHLSPKLVGKFLRLLRLSHDEKYVKLVSTLCVCDGAAVTRNQNTICDLLRAEKALTETVILPVRQSRERIEVWAYDGWLNLDSLAEVSAERDNGRVSAYFLALLDLVANLALKRNHQTDTLRAYFPLDTCFACAFSPALNDTVRSKFLRVLLSLHIDQGDMKPLALPRLTRAKGDAVLAFAKSTMPQAVANAKTFVRESLSRFDSSQRLDQPERNSLVLEVLHLAHFLVKCGVYTSIDEVRALAKPLISLLDGTTDVVITHSVVRALFTRRDTSRYEIREDTAVIMQCKREICWILSTICDIALDMQLTTLLGLLGEADSEDQPEESIDIVSSQTSLEAKHYPKQSSLSTVNGRPVSMSREELETAVKGELLDWGTDGRRLLAILMDLMMYKDRSVSTNSFRLLVKLFSRRAELLQCLQEVQFLDTPETLAAYRKVLADVVELNGEVETAELWLGRDSLPSASNPQDRVLFTLKRFTDLCSSKRRLDESTWLPIDLLTDSEVKLWRTLFDPAEAPDSHFQRLFANLQVFDSALELLSHKGIVEGYSESRMREAMRHCYLFLAKFCQNNAPNQELLFPSVEHTLEDLSRNACAGVLLMEIFRNNPKLCGSVKSRFIRSIVRHIHEMPMSSSKVWLMDVFHVLIACNEDHFPNNQIEVATELCRIMAVFNNEELAEQVRTGVESCVQFSTDTQSEMAVPLPLAFFSSFLEVLGRCAANYNTQVQAICKQVFPLPHAFSLLQQSALYWPLRSAVLLFIEKVFLDYEYSHDQLPERDLWTLVEVASADLELIFQNYTRGGKRFRSELERKSMWINERKHTLSDLALQYTYSTLIPVLTTVLKKRGSSKRLVTHLDTAKSISYFATRFHKMSPNEKHLGATTNLIRALQGFTQLRNFIEGVRLKPLRRSTRVATRVPMVSMQTHDDGRFVGQSSEVQESVDAEFLHMVRCMRDVERVTSEELAPGHSIPESEFLGATIVFLRHEVAEGRLHTPEMGVKVLRRLLESLNPDSRQPAAEWATEDWTKHQVAVMHCQDQFRKLEAVPFVLELYVATASRAVKEECILLMIALLVGGNHLSQNAFLKEMRRDPKNRFLRQVKESLHSALTAVRRLSLKAAGDHFFDEELENEEIEPIANPVCEMRRTLRFIQLLCEGHNLSLQEFLREQSVSDSVSPFSVNIVSFVGTLLCTYTRVLHKCNIEVGHQLLDTLTETVQGPCHGAQTDLSQPNIIDSCRDLLTCLRYKRDREARQLHTKEDREDISELKGKTAIFLLSLLEGGGSQEVIARIASFLDFGKIRERMASVFRDFVEDDLDLDPEGVTLEEVDATLQKDSFRSHVQEGFSLYMLMQTLAESSDTARRHLPTKSAKPLEYLAYRFFQQHTGSIEVVFDRVLERVLFPIQPVCRFLSESRKQDLLDTVSRDTPAAKVQGLLSGSTLLIDEMELNETRSHHSIVVTFEVYQFLNTSCFVVAFYINLIMLFWYDFTEDSNHYMGKSSRNWIEGLGTVLVVLCGLTLCAWMHVEGVLQVQSRWKTRALHNRKKRPAPAVVDQEYLQSLRTRDTVAVLLSRGPDAEEFATERGRDFRHVGTAIVYYAVSAYYMFTSLTFKVLVLTTVLAGTGLADMFLFSFLLFTIIFRNHTLMGVVRAVVGNSHLLLMTLMMAMAIWFIYAMWGFYITPWQYWQSGFNTAGWGESLCQDLWQCWLTTMDNGIRLSGGIGDILIKFPFDDKSRWYSRFFLDSSYFFVFRLIILSIITGIIIDSFAQMREAKKAKDLDEKSKCFICSLDRAELDRLGNGYKKHCAEEHNVWHYLYFLIHLKYKDRTEYTGAESRCAALIAAGNITWVPLHRALCLQQGREGESEADALSQKLAAAVETAKEINAFLAP